MQKLLISIFLFVFHFATFAQVGIGTNNPDASAQLEVSSSVKGFLPPRVALTARNSAGPISSPATGLLVYNTASAGSYPNNVLPGFYYNSGTPSSVFWTRLNDEKNDYQSIRIGSGVSEQFWMEKNLEVTVYSNGDNIPYVPDATTWSNLTTGAWCYYNNDPSSGYGKLYNWYAVIDQRGLCPSGWHIPTDSEWATLETNLGGSSVAGGKMKTTGTTRWTSTNNGASNSSSFSGLPGGHRNNIGGFNYIGQYGYWWSATELDANFSFLRYLSYNNDDITRYSLYNKNYGFSVRCLKD